MPCLPAMHVRSSKPTPTKSRASGACASGSKHRKAPCPKPIAPSSPRRSKAAERCARFTPCARSWRRFGNAPMSRASNCWRACRIGATGRNRAELFRCRTFRGSCGAMRSAGDRSVAIKSPPDGGLFIWVSPSFPRKPELSLELGFLVHDVLAGDGIEFLDLHLLRHQLLVLAGGVEVASPRRRFQFDLFAHELLRLRQRYVRRARRASEGPPTPHRCRSCRSCAARRWSAVS